MMADNSDLPIHQNQTEIRSLDDPIELKNILGKRNNITFGIILDYISGIQLLGNSNNQTDDHVKFISTLVIHQYGLELNIKKVKLRQSGFTRSTYGILYEDIKDVSIKLDVDESDHSFLGKALINGAITTGTESVFGTLKSTGVKETLRGAFVTITTKNDNVITLYAKSSNISEINSINNNINFINDKYKYNFYK